MGDKQVELINESVISDFKVEEYSLMKSKRGEENIPRLMAIWIYDLVQIILPKLTFLNSKEFKCDKCGHRMLPVSYIPVLTRGRPTG